MLSLAVGMHSLAVGMHSLAAHRGVDHEIVGRRSE
jgi:hypothetical protein